VLSSQLRPRSQSGKRKRAGAIKRKARMHVDLFHVERRKKHRKSKKNPKNTETWKISRQKRLAMQKSGQSNVTANGRNVLQLGLGYRRIRKRKKGRNKRVSASTTGEGGLGCRKKKTEKARADLIVSGGRSSEILRERTATWARRIKTAPKRNQPKKKKQLWDGTVKHA